MMTTKSPLQEHYQHFTVLSQALVDFIIFISKIEKAIRSTTIILYLSRFVKRDVTFSWINQLLRREGIERPIGRPTRKYKDSEPSYLLRIGIIHREYIDLIGIPLMQDVMYHFKVEELFVSILKEVKADINNTSCKWTEQTIIKFIQTETAIALTPGIKNFEEALNADISHAPMLPSVSQTDPGSSLKMTHLILTESL